MDQISSSSRPRAASHTFSHRSDHSQGSRSKHEVLTDNPAEKSRRDSFWKGGSKANPNTAFSEAQPGDAAVTEKATIESLRNVQHKDTNGNVITEPDLANPTRPRWERPLDTIRSFEKAIDGGYKRRSMSRSESNYTYEQSRRSSYYGGSNYDSGRQEYGQQYNGGHYGSRRQDGYSDAGASPAAPPTRNRYGQRMVSRSSSAYGFNPQHGYNDPYDTGVNTASDGTGPWANSTDPSSENSSIDRAHGAGKAPDPYGYDVQNGAPIMEEYASDSDGGYGMSWGNSRNGHGAGAPAVPSHSQAPPVRAPIKLGGGGGGSESAPNYTSQGGSLPSTARPTAVKEEKKKGFFKKRFSKG